VSKLKANIMLLELRSTHGLSDKGFNDLLDVVTKLPYPNKLPEKIYLAKQMSIIYRGSRFLGTPSTIVSQTRLV